MIKIRRNVFETNSSMVHTLVLMNDDQYETWKAGRLYIDFCDNKFYTREQIEDEMIKRYGEDAVSYYGEEGFDRQVSYDIEAESIREYTDRIADWYETYDEEYVIDGTPVHAVGYYGHD